MVPCLDCVSENLILDLVTGTTDLEELSPVSVPAPVFPGVSRRGEDKVTTGARVLTVVCSWTLHLTDLIFHLHNLMT